MGRYESNKLSLTSFRQILLLPHSTKTRSIKFPPPVEDVARTVGKNDQSVVVGCRDGVVQLEFKFADESTDDGSKLQISELRLGNNVSRSPPTASETEKKKSPVHQCTYACQRRMVDTDSLFPCSPTRTQSQPFDHSHHRTAYTPAEPHLRGLSTLTGPIRTSSSTTMGRPVKQPHWRRRYHPLERCKFHFQMGRPEREGRGDLHGLYA